MELAADPDYDSTIPTVWTSLANWWNSLAIVQWYRGLSVSDKFALGCALFVLAVVIAVATGGAAEVVKVTVEVAIGIGVATSSWAVSQLLSGKRITAEELLEAAVDAFVISSLFAFAEQSVNAIKYIARSKPYPDVDLSVECAGYCFIAGTLVHCENELKKIEDVEVGDKVLSYNEETGEQEFKTVLHLFRNESKDWTGITVEGKEIVSTPGHKYYLPVIKQWVSAKDLKIGDVVLLSNGQQSDVRYTRAIHYETPQTTYNFEVADFHTYYVETGVLVHNKKCSELHMTRKEAIKYGKEFLGEGYTKRGPGLYRSADGMRDMHFDLTHHGYKRIKHSPTHINLYKWKNAVSTGVRNDLKIDIHIFFV